MTSYTSVFGGQNINPSQLSYRAITLSANQVLVWPLNAPPGSVSLADKIDVTPTAPGFTITLPDATRGSTGIDVLFRNLGGSSFTVLDATGTPVVTLSPGTGWFVYLASNTTVAGTWRATQFGTGSTPVDAASLAGFGIVALATTLNQSCPISTKNANYNLSASDRAQLIVSTGGAITFTFSSAASLGNNWFALVRNDGSGSLTLDPAGGELIDGATTITLLQTESCMVVCDGTQLRTVGRGRAPVATVSSVNVTGGGVGVQALTTSEVQAQIQQYNGTLTGNKQFEFGTIPGFWFVYNNLTLAGFTATWRVNGSDPGVTSASIAAGTRGIIVSNGANMFLAFNAGSGTVTNVATGTGLTGGPITTTGTISLANTAVTPGTYTVLGGTVDAQGRLTSASDRLSVLGYGWQFDTGTADADPGPGLFRFNNATQNLATFIYIDNEPNGGGDASAFLDSLGAGTSPSKAIALLRDSANAANWMWVNITGVTTATGYRRLAITVTASSSANPFASTSLIWMGFSRTGDVGATGATGATGPAGPPGGGNLAIARIDNAVGGETSITVAYDPPNVIVIKNGATLQPTEFTATSGTSVVLNVALVAGDTLQVLGLQGVALSGEVPSSRQIATQFSLTGGGDLTNNRVLNLVGDVASPGNNKLYGTNGAGARGWYDLPATSGGATVTSTASGFALTASSNRVQAVTFTADSQSVTLPDATTITTLGGPIFVIANDGARPFGVRANGGALLAVVGPGGAAECYLEANGTAAGSWSISGRELQPALTTCDVSLGTTYTALPAYNIGARLTDTLSLHFVRNGSGHPFVIAVDHSTYPATVGTPVLISAANLDVRDVRRISNTKAVVFLDNSTNNAFNITVSGTACTVSSSATAAVWSGSALYGPRYQGTIATLSLTAALGANSDVVVGVRWNGVTNGLEALAVDCSGANPIAGSTLTIFTDPNMQPIGCYRISNTTALVAWFDNTGTAGSPFTIRACVLTLSGTTLTAGSIPTGIQDTVNNFNNITMCQLTSTSYLVCWYQASGTLVRAVAITTSGTTTTFGSPINIETTDATDKINSGFGVPDVFSPQLMPISSTTAFFFYGGEVSAGVSASARCVVLTESSGSVSAGTILYGVFRDDRGMPFTNPSVPSSVLVYRASDNNGTNSLMVNLAISGTTVSVSGTLALPELNISQAAASRTVTIGGVVLATTNGNVSGLARPGMVYAFRQQAAGRPMYLGVVQVPSLTTAITRPIPVGPFLIAGTGVGQFPSANAITNSARIFALEFVQ